VSLRGGVDVPIPGLRLVSEANQREHWAKKARRVKAQRTLVTLVLRGTVARDMMLVAPLAVTITRISPRRLDDDNATGSAKAVRDAVAAILGVDDRDDRVSWRVEQAKGPFGIRIAIRAASDVETRLKAS
jgi:hypothetical protein